MTRAQEEEYTEIVKIICGNLEPQTYCRDCYAFDHCKIALALYEAGYRKDPDLVKPAYWKTREACNDYIWVECSNCGFRVENFRAVHLGKSSTDIIGYKWHACPSCTAKMILDRF